MFSRAPRSHVCNASFYWSHAINNIIICQVFTLTIKSKRNIWSWWMKLGTIAYWDQGKVFLSRWDIFIFCFTEKKGGPLFFKIQNLGMWGMYSGVKAYEKHDGGNNKFLGASGDPLLTPYRSKKIYFHISHFIYP